MPQETVRTKVQNAANNWAYKRDCESNYVCHISHADALSFYQSLLSPLALAWYLPPLQSIRPFKRYARSTQTKTQTDKQTFLSSVDDFQSWTLNLHQYKIFGLLHFLLLNAWLCCDTLCGAAHSKLCLVTFSWIHTKWMPKPKWNKLLLAFLCFLSSI